MSKNYKLHGGKGEHLYEVWCAIKQRCFNPNNKRYANYGGRGITICDEWLNDYLAFKEWAMENGYEDNGDLSIDRIDNDGNYEPNNCRWVDRIVQANNKSNNIVITYNGKSQTLRKWSEETGINADTLYHRYRAGKTPEEIFRKYDVKNIGCTRTDVDNKKVFALKQQGKSINEIAEVFGCSPNTIRNRLAKLKELEGDKE